ncbi:DinB family protein [Gracilibacillus sp. S3-1-1]|uniref:DinB family protein n=1 Tax=Gracilibacillus pellucidus TaxID=3095368 RepID=A0ACC6M3R2_9BACI|nr:DinB family protein [Gracilibacillus sp. S3-1-1]MDX8045594.1 DinB family protein [Gracilibacillus sp. S3-1-1]
MVNYRLTSMDGYADKMGELVWMLQHARQVTLNEIDSLTKQALDFLSDSQANSIGALLSHIAAIEYVHQVISFEKRDLSTDELSKWSAALQLGTQAREAIQGHSISYYLEQLANVRSDTLSYLKSKDDDWLYEEHQWDNGVTYNQYYLWFHVLEDEINHRGQIRAIKRTLKQLNM